jgi:hypothetical protein
MSDADSLRLKTVSRKNLLSGIRHILTTIKTPKLIEV